MSDSLTKQFLIAMPSMEDPNFSRSVTIICEHNQDGAMGIIVNQPTTLLVNELLSPLIDDVTSQSSPSTINHHQPVYAGGPVQLDRGFILHDSDKQWDSSHIIDNDLSLTTSEDILLAIAQGKGPKNSIIALGYAGWAAGQLEEELSANSWLTVPYEADIIFNTPVEQRWQSAATKIGVDVHLISNETGHA
ncbi:MAG: YqgE/AlgH family protein [Gammaproteobacteria bacterium]